MAFGTISPKVKMIRSIEAETMVMMAKTMILPAVERFAGELAANAAAKRALDGSLSCAYAVGTVQKLSRLSDCIAAAAEALEQSLLTLTDAADVREESCAIRDRVLTRMRELRLACDEAETVTEKRCWPHSTGWNWWNVRRSRP